MPSVKVVLAVLLLVLMATAFLVFSSVPYGFSGSTVEMSGGAIRLFIVDLDGVGGSRAANHSAVVEGARQATFINAKRKLSFIASGYEVNVYVNVTYELVNDWQSYRQLVENANNTIIVNTHDEILPVPSGYARESWVSVIADFMLNRWGTWVHTGGLPFRIVRYENGTTEEWNDGFKSLMEQANQKVTIENPPSLPLLVPADSNSDSLIGDFGIYLDSTNAYSLADFAEVLIDSANGFHYCLKFGENNVDPCMMQIYNINLTSNSNVYAPSASLMLTNGTDSYGIFIYSSPWKFTDGFGNYISDFNCSMGMGAIPTAAALSSEAGYAAGKIVEVTSAKFKDENMLQKANSAFYAGNYKQAIVYAEKATSADEPNILQTALLVTIVGGVITSGGIIYYHNISKKKKQP